MNPGPLRRLVGTLGLLALAPIAVLVLTGALDLVTAAQRALVVLLVVVVVGRLTGTWMQSVAQHLERQEAEAALEADAPSPGPAST